MSSTVGILGLELTILSPSADVNLSPGGGISLSSVTEVSEGVDVLITSLPGACSVST